MFRPRDPAVVDRSRAEGPFYREQPRDWGDLPQRLHCKSVVGRRSAVVASLNTLQDRRRALRTLAAKLGRYIYIYIYIFVLKLFAMRRPQAFRGCEFLLIGVASEI